MAVARLAGKKPWHPWWCQCPRVWDAPFAKLRGVHNGARRRGTSNWSTFCPTNHAAALAAPWQVVMLPALHPTLVAAAAVAVLGTEGSADAEAASWSALPDAWLSQKLVGSPAACLWDALIATCGTDGGQTSPRPCIAQDAEWVGQHRPIMTWRTSFWWWVKRLSTTSHTDTLTHIDNRHIYTHTGSHTEAEAETETGTETDMHAHTHTSTPHEHRHTSQWSVAATSWLPSP